MTAEGSQQETPSRPFALLEAGLAILLTCTAIALTFAMPELIAEGGISAAQDFLRLSPVFFPEVTFGVLSALGLIFTASALRQLSAAEPSTEELGTDILRRVVFVFVISLLYPFILPWLGYGLTTALLIGSMTLFLGNRVWWQVLLFSVATPVVIRFVFERLLKISLPSAEIDAIDGVEEALMQFLARLLLTR